MVMELLRTLLDFKLSKKVKRVKNESHLPRHSKGIPEGCPITRMKHIISFIVVTQRYQVVHCDMHVEKCQYKSIGPKIGAAASVCTSTSQKNISFCRSLTYGTYGIYYKLYFYNFHCHECFFYCITVVFFFRRNVYFLNKDKSYYEWEWSANKGKKIRKNQVYGRKL